MDSPNNNITMENENEGTLKYNGWKAMPFVIGNETFEKLGTIGTSANLLVYLTTVFNMKSMAATNVINIFNGSANFGTLIGAFLCDTYFGRYKTLAVATISSFMGLSLLALTAAIPGLHPAHCGMGQSCLGPTTGQLAFLIGGLIFLVIGAGGIRPCNLAFGADQFDPKTESGKRGISSFFNWYYFTLTFAVMISVTVVVYIQTNISWAIGLGLPALFMFLSCAWFFLGTKLYVMIKPQGSPLVSVLQVIAASFRKRRFELPDKPALSLFDYVPDESDITNPKLPYTNQFRFLEKAAIVTDEDTINPDGSPTDPWRLCSVQQVEQVKCLIRVLPIWIAGIIYSVSTTTMGNYTVFQALQSDRRLGRSKFNIPAASYSIFTMLALTFWIPFYDRVLVPKLRKITGKDDGITVLQKFGVGIGIIIISLISCGFVENYRRLYSHTRPTLGISQQRGAISSLSAMWLVIPLGLSGLSEAFTMIALVEFYYRQFPENMRSIGAAFLFCGLAMSSYLSSLLQSIVDRMSSGPRHTSWLTDDLNNGRLDYFYYLMAVLEMFNLMYFLLSAKWYRYRGTSQENPSQIALV